MTALLGVALFVGSLGARPNNPERAPRPLLSQPHHVGLWSFYISVVGAELARSEPRYAGLAAQNATGELRVAVSDPSGLPVDATVELVSEANQFRQRFHTDVSGRVLASRLPDGVYRVEIRQP